MAMAALAGYFLLTNAANVPFRCVFKIQVYKYYVFIYNSVYLVFLYNQNVLYCCIRSDT